MAPVWTVADLTNPAVSVSALRMHLREDSPEQDQVIEAALLAATRAVEKFTQRLLVRREIVFRAPCLPCGRQGLRLPGGRVQSVTSMTVEGDAFTGFEIVGDSPAMLVPNADWPIVTSGGLPVSVTYICGPDNPSGDLVAAVKLIAAELYERRSTGSTVAVSQVPLSAQELMMPHRILPR